MTDLTSWLAALDEARLERVLSRRPDATAGSIPRNLNELGQRLGHPQSVAMILDAAPSPLRQVSEALLALSTPRTEARLRKLLERREPDHDAAVAGTLERLYDCAIAWSCEDGSIGLAAGLAQVFPRPLGLGPPLHSALERMPGNSLVRALRNLGEPKPPTRRNDAAAALQRRLTDPAAVRAIVAAAPPSIVDQLHAIAGRGSADTGGALGSAAFDVAAPDFDSAEFEFHDDYFPDNGFSTGRAHDAYVHTNNFGRYAARFEAEIWAIERGLMSGTTFGGETYMPAEIASALRGTAYAPFTPYPPPIPSTVIDPITVESGAAAAAADFAGQAVAVLDLIARAPLTQLKSGGIGARDLTRVAKTVGIDQTAVRLTIELAVEAGLVAMDRGFLQASETYSSWREMDPAAAYSVLIDAWLGIALTPTEATDAEGRATRLPQRRGTHSDAPAARDVLLTVLASLPPGRATTRAGVAPALVWSRPRVRQIPQDVRTPYATVWAEADRLGIIAAGALSRIGHAIDDRDGTQLATVLRAVLPASTDAARFGSDLTVLVSGSPSARVSSVLDHAADRESRGAGVTWRFSPASVRRALDDGADPGDLLAALEAIAVGELPQPLRYLVNDVARRHGELRISKASTVIRGDDAALLAQVAADRGLRGLGLRLVAPTVIASAKSESETLLALRAAGYLPVLEALDPSATPAPTFAAASRIPRPPARSPADRPSLLPRGGGSSRLPADSVVSPRALAVHLLAAQTVIAADTADAADRAEAADRADAAAATATEKVVGQLNPRLSADEIHQLAYAIETGGSVSITYESTSGARTQRVIGDANLGGGMLNAWCYLRDDERFFLVDRILSVAPGSP